MKRSSAVLKERVKPARVAIREEIDRALRDDGLALLPPMEAETSLRLLNEIELRFKVTMLDPWYNKGIGGQRPDYKEFVLNLLEKSGRNSEHVYLWGFPEIIACFVEKIPAPLELVSWLTWYYKNNPSVIRGWRSSQNACLHLSIPGAKLYPEHFLNEKQQELQLNGKLRYMPGPTSVIEAALIVGFVGKKERTGHPSQKPEAVYEPLYKMTTKEGDLVFDPMAGSGTTGAIARRQGFKAILADMSDEYTSMIEERLGIKRLPIEDELKRYLAGEE